MLGFQFTKYIPPPSEEKIFPSLRKIFLQLLQYTNGDVSEALQWLNDLDKQYELTSDNYGIGDFIDDLKREGYITDAPSEGSFQVTSKTEHAIRTSALEEIFGKLKKSSPGNHRNNKSGQGDDFNADIRAFQFGDNLDAIDITTSIHNAQINHGIDQFKLTDDDLSVKEKDHQSQTATVLMIDISHSMILYGEDRITPAKKVAMALAELIRIKYPKDSLDIIVFGDDAWPVQLKDLPFLQVGPYHTNTLAGLELAMDLLRRRKTKNKQIFMITDGKPTCIKENGRYYKNSFGLDRKVISKTMNMAHQCRRLKIPITTFMIAKDPYLQQFVREFTEANQGKAFYSSLNGLGNFVFEDFERNRKKTI
jgi:uncharacterized protein with von Willebrand factor type A (vWA) domain